ncbi:hypothetical protein MNBD_GAMMA25-1408 [hydrothermal vent metagenome]|uniref:Uncharacterized protein n=1 Tax=hydrothermal vent metagenome TaxID=652676 RepID=A0A3B1BGH9_9ZZZZ
MDEALFITAGVQCCHLHDLAPIVNNSEKLVVQALCPSYITVWRWCVPCVVLESFPVL